MKNTSKIILSLLAAVLLFGSCKEDKLLTYDRSDNVYFRHKRWVSPNGIEHNTQLTYDGINYAVVAYNVKEALDSITFSFARLDESITEATMIVPVTVVGDVADVDRKFGYKIRETSTAVEGVDYRILDAFIPAKKIHGGLVVELSREALNKEGSFLYIDLELIANENFTVQYDSIPRNSVNEKNLVSTLTFRVWFSNSLLQPKNWFLFEIGYFSSRKAELFLEHTTITEEILYGDEAPELAFRGVWRDEFTKWFNDQNISGNTVYEKDGRTPMTLEAKAPTPVPAP